MNANNRDFRNTDTQKLIKIYLGHVNLGEFDHKHRMITLSVITLSGLVCDINFSFPVLMSVPPPPIRHLNLRQSFATR